MGSTQALHPTGQDGEPCHRRQNQNLALAATHSLISPPWDHHASTRHCCVPGDEEALALFVGWVSPGLARRRVGRAGPVFTLPSAKSQHRGGGKGSLALCLASLQLPTSSCPKLAAVSDLKLLLCSVIEVLQLALLGVKAFRELEEGFSLLSVGFSLEPAMSSS